MLHYQPSLSISLNPNTSPLNFKLNTTKKTAAAFAEFGSWEQMMNFYCIKMTHSFITGGDF